MELKKHNGSNVSNPPGERPGTERSRPSHLALPNIVRVRQNGWDKHHFSKEDALNIKHAGEDRGYDFFINVGNIHLLTEIKGKPKTEPKLLEEQYVDGMVLIGLALLNEFEKSNKYSDEEENVYKKISIVTRAISPFLLPMIYNLGDISGDF